MDYNAPIDKYAKMDARFQQLKRSPRGKPTGARRRLQNHNGRLAQRNRRRPGCSHSGRNSLPTPQDADKVLMLESSPTTRKATARYYSAVHLTNPLSRARGTAVCLGAGADQPPLPLPPQDTAQNAGRLIKYLQTLVEAQAKTGKLDKIIFGAGCTPWTRMTRTRQLMKQLSASAAYAKLPKVFIG